MASFFTDNYIKLDSATSANNFAYNLLKSGKIKEGTVVTALYQSKGQGQMGLKWESEHGKSILMSIVLSPDILLKNQFPERQHHFENTTQHETILETKAFLIWSSWDLTIQFILSQKYTFLEQKFFVGEIQKLRQNLCLPKNTVCL